MRTLINYFRQCFCKHNFTFEEKRVEDDNAGFFCEAKKGIKVSYICQKCGWHKSFWKYI